jgi:purine-binding chemotaxis protein CheW
MDTVVVFKIDEQQLALPVSQVLRVIWAVEITAMPGQGDRKLGVINVEGTVVPVANIRNILQLPSREIDLDDHIVIAEADGQRVAFLVDKVDSVLHCESNELSAINTHEDQLSSQVLKHNGELIVILSIRQLLNEMGNKTMVAGGNR